MFPPWSDWSGTFQNPWPLGCYRPRAASKDKRTDICWLLTLPFPWKMVLSFMTWSPVPGNRCKWTILLDLVFWKWIIPYYVRCKWTPQALNSQFWPRHWQSMVYFMVAGLAFPFGAAFGGILLHQFSPVQPKLEPLRAAGRLKQSLTLVEIHDETITGINMNSHELTWINMN